MRALRRFIPRKYLRSQRLRDVLLIASGGRVMTGPFATMELTDLSPLRVFLPKLMGTYELEVRDALEDAMARAPRNVVVAGAAEGYYAIGIALRLSTARVTAFEADPRARAALQEAARSNGVADRIVVAGLCDAGGMSKALAGAGPTMVVCDIEGSEGVLIDPAVVPSLLEADILVETHDFLVPGVTEVLVQRFQESHRVTRVGQRPRRVEDAPSLALPGAFEGALLQAMNEHRPMKNGWLHLTRP